jgi:hypothetical protein
MAYMPFNVTDVLVLSVTYVYGSYPAGAQFGDDYINDNQSLSNALESWGKDNGSRNESDPSAGRKNLPLSDPAIKGGKNRESSRFLRGNPTNSN